MGCPDRRRLSGFVGGLLVGSRVKLALGLLLTFAYSFSVFVAPLVSSHLVDDVLGSSSTGVVRRGLVLFLVVCLAQPLLGFLKDSVFLCITEGVTFGLRRRMHQKTMVIVYRKFEVEPTGDYVSRVTNDARLVSHFMSDVFAVLVKDVVLVLMIAVGMCLQSLEISSLIAVAFVVIYLINSAASRRLEQMSRENLENYDRLCSVAADIWEQALLVRVYRLRSCATKKFDSVIQGCRDLNMRMGALRITASSLGGAATVISLAGIYGLGTLGIMNGKMTLGSVIALGLYFQLLAGPLQEVNAAIMQYKQVRPSLLRVASYLEEEEEPRDGSCASSVAEAGWDSCDENHEQLSLRVHDLHFSYDNGAEKNGRAGERLVLQGLSFACEGPGLHVLAGHSGCGKSTLLKLLLHLYPVGSGEVELCGRSLGPDAARALCAYVPQEAKLVEGETLGFNLLLRDATSDDDELRIDKAVEALGLASAVGKRGKGYLSHRITKDCYSGGESRRLLLIRAALSGRPILLLDEISSGLDPESARLVVAYLEGLAQDRLVLVATHDPKLISAAKQVIWLDGISPANPRELGWNAAALSGRA